MGSTFRGRAKFRVCECVLLREWNAHENVPSDGTLAGCNTAPAEPQQRQRSAPRSGPLPLGAVAAEAGLPVPPIPCGGASGRLMSGRGLLRPQSVDGERPVHGLSARCGLAPIDMTIIAWVWGP